MKIKEKVTTNIYVPEKIHEKLKKDKEKKQISINFIICKILADYYGIEYP